MGAYIDKADNLDFAAAFSRIECHYFVNGIFVEEAYILKNASKLVNIPVHIVQGRYDVVCPAKSAGSCTRHCLIVSWFLSLMLGTLWERLELQRCLSASLTNTNECVEKSTTPKLYIISI